MKKNNWKNKKKYQILTSMLYFCNCTAMSPKLSALGKVLLVPSKAPPCDTQPSTFSHVIISRSPLTRPSKPDLIPKGLFPSLMHVRTNDLTGREKKSFWLSILKTNHHFRKKDLKAFACASLFLFNIVCNWLLFLSVLPISFVYIFKGSISSLGNNAKKWHSGLRADW